MISSSARFVIAFNGEVYNFEDIRTEIGGGKWKGHSDTEVILAAIEEWGLDAALQRFVGMFAFSLVDLATGTVSLVRDRLGVKPLYWAATERHLVFGSELKPIMEGQLVPMRVNERALEAFVSYGFIPQPMTIFENVGKLAPASILEFDLSTGRARRRRVYWSLAQAVRCGAESQISSDNEALAEVESVLQESVRLRMISDVPLGVFLSGGIDSSLVTAMMVKEAGVSVKTFTIGFEEQSHDEARFAAKVAHHLGTEHQELMLPERLALEVIPRLPEIYDEPFADSSQIPTFLVSQMARSSVTVALSGDGGDELFGGYNRHSWIPRARVAHRLLGNSMGSNLAAWLTGSDPDTRSRRLERMIGALPHGLRVRDAGDKFLKLSRVLRTASVDAAWESVVSVWREDAVKGVLKGRGGFGSLAERFSDDPTETVAERLMYLDSLTYLPDDILAKVDRASMAVGLEAREPLLDHRLVELAWRLPLRMKIRNGRGKWILRRVLGQSVPDALFSRPKAGFAIPLAKWLRSDLRGWAEDLLSSRKLSEHGLFQEDEIRKVWNNHLAGLANHEHELWTILMFQAWYGHYSSRLRS
jgi:asparagine synthase (glutamine-hydrolysing)